MNAQGKRHVTFMYVWGCYAGEWCHVLLTLISCVSNLLARLMAYPLSQSILAAQAVPPSSPRRRRHGSRPCHDPRRGRRGRRRRRPGPLRHCVVMPAPSRDPRPRRRAGLHDGPVVLVLRRRRRDGAGQGLPRPPRTRARAPRAAPSPCSDTPRGAPAAQARLSGA